MTPGRDYRVGRDPLSDIVIDDARVSWHQAVLRPEDGHWTIEDEHSTNGTCTDGRHVDTRDVGAGSVIRFGNPADGPRAVLTGRTRPSPGRPSVVSNPAGTGTYRQPTAVRPLPTRTVRTVRIGRAPGNDLVVGDLVVSRRPAEPRALSHGTHEIADLGSHNGTYLDSPLRGPACPAARRSLLRTVPFPAARAGVVREAVGTGGPQPERRDHGHGDQVGRHGGEGLRPAVTGGAGLPGEGR